MSFTDGKPRIATEAECNANWGGEPNGRRFRCYLCGHRFEIGDYWRWVWSTGRSFKVDGREYGLSNFMVCESCDCDTVLDKWVEKNIQAYTQFWWFI